MPVLRSALTSSVALLVLAPLTCAALVACHDSPPPAEPSSPPPPASTRINEIHGNVKEELGEAASKTRRAIESVQKDVQHGVRKGATEIGVRPEVVGVPAGSAAPEPKPPAAP